MTEQKITPCLWFDFNAEEARRCRRLELDCAGDAEAPRLGVRHHRRIALEKVLRVGKVFDQLAASVAVIDS
jgi:hypothetical protein